MSCRNMKRRKIRLTDLSFDVLSHIMHCVAKSSNGAATFVVLSSVCRVFKDLANDANILKGMNFQGTELPPLHFSFWHRKGLLFRCMVHRNLSAYEFLVKYLNDLEPSYKEHKRALFRWTVIRLARTGAVDIVNTRSRRKALNVAEEEYQKIYDAVSIDCDKAKELLDMLRDLRENVGVLGLLAAFCCALSSPSRNHEGFQCRSYHSGPGSFPTPFKSNSFSQTSIKREIAALSPKIPSTSIYFSADDSKNDRNTVKGSAVAIPMVMKLDDISLMEDGDFVDGVYFSELWAGATYSNSPPLSSLPIPKFSMRPKRSVSLELPSSVSPIDFRPVAKSAPASPTRECSPSPIHFLSDVESVMKASYQLYLQQQSVDKTDFATKALCRILNLDNGDQ